MRAKPRVVDASHCSVVMNSKWVTQNHPSISSQPTESINMKRSVIVCFNRDLLNCREICFN